MLDAVQWRNVTTKLLELERNQWLDGEAIATLQVERLGKLLRHAASNCPYYGERFRKERIDPEEIRSLEDLHKMPILTKETLRARVDDLCSTAYPKDKLIHTATGGSTGTPTPVRYTGRHLSWRTAASNRLYRTAGRFAFTRTINLAGSPIDLRRFQAASERIKSFFRQEIRLPAFDLDQEDYLALMDVIQGFCPEFLMGYCAALRQLARTAIEERATVRIPRVMPLAEVVTQVDRNLFREAFGAETFELYGSREITAIAGECEAHEGLHVSADLLILEVLKNGEPVPLGEEGEIVITDLLNFGMPFIRYAIGDVGRLIPKPCSCGRGLPLMEITQGRVLDRIFLPGGRIVPSALFPHLFKEVWQEVREYQVMQTAPDAIEILVVPTLAWTQETKRTLIHRLTHHLGPETRIRITRKEHIPREPSGKFRPVKGFRESVL